MSGLNIRVHISARAAILAGKTRLGTQVIDVTGDKLESLPVPLRLEIALLFEGAPELGTLPTDPQIVEPTLEAIVPVLEMRASVREETERVKRISDARAAEEAAIAARTVGDKEAIRIKAIRDWVNKNGDDDQKARAAEGFLPPDEVLDTIMDELLDVPFEEHILLRRGDACDCACAGHVVFSEHAPRYMDQSQHTKLRELRESVPEAATVEIVEHQAQCPSCKCLPIMRITGRVVLPWHGWILRRDFSL